MSGCVRSALGVLVLAVGLAGSACGRYGPPVRASERGAAAPAASQDLDEELDENLGPTPPSELPGGADPVAPDPEAP
jgi:hypothetical protein